MKHVLLTLCFIYGSVCFAQTGPFIKAVYGKKLVEFSPEKMQSLTPSQLAGMKRLKTSLQAVRYALVSNGKAARFEHKRQLTNEAHPASKHAIGFNGGHGVFYTDLQNKISIHKIEISAGTWREKYRLPYLDWQLDDQTKVIAGYRCYHATAELRYHDFRGDVLYKYEAWYTPELPAMLGPGKCVGLPGMVLEGGNGAMRFYIKRLKFSKKPVDVEKPTQGPLITPEKRHEIFNQTMHNIID